MRDYRVRIVKNLISYSGHSYLPDEIDVPDAESRTRAAGTAKRGLALRLLAPCGRLRADPGSASGLAARMPSRAPAWAV